MTERVRPDGAQPGPVTGPVQHAASHRRSPRLAVIRALQLDQQHAMPGLLGVLGGHVLENRCGPAPGWPV